MMPDSTTLLLTALIGGLVGVLGAVFTGLKRVLEAKFRGWEKRTVRQQYAHGLRRWAEFGDLARSVHGVEGVDRVLVFVGEDSGGLPAAGKPYTVRAIHGWTNRPGENVYDRYNFNIRADPAYVTMLSRMVDAGSVVNTTAEMADGCILRQMYTDEGVKQSLLYYLTCDGSQLTYLSVASYSGEFTQAQRTKVELKVARLRSILDDAGPGDGES